MNDRDWESLAEDIMEEFDSYSVREHVPNLENNVKKFVSTLQIKYDENLRKAHAKQFEQDLHL